MNPAKIDVSVLILFFNRPEQLSQVFEQVRQARPARLFLYQDGPRGERDMPGIEACRKVVEEIDWECEVHRKYQERNYGCDPSEYLSQKWAFSLTDKCIVLEDDDVPSQSFFPFCKELLDRYEDDPRVAMICGFNEDEVTPHCSDSYFFTSIFAIWGWASWRRVIDQWEGDYAFLDDKENMKRLEELSRQRRYRKDFIPMCRNHRATGKEYYESIFWASMLLHIDTTPRAYRRIFTMQRHEMDFPLRHPRYLIEDVSYKERLYKTNAWGHPWIKVGRSLEELWLNLRHGNLSFIGKSVKRRLKKWLGGDKHQ